MYSETINAIGLALIGVSGLVAAITIPVFIIIGNVLRKRLEDEYGVMERKGSRANTVFTKGTR